MPTSASRQSVCQNLEIASSLIGSRKGLPLRIRIVNPYSGVFLFAKDAPSVLFSSFENSISSDGMSVFLTKSLQATTRRPR